MSAAAVEAVAYEACLDHDPEVMFPEPEDAEGVAAAKAVCASCPFTIKAECIDRAIRRREKHGIWGGHTTSELETIRRRRYRARRAASKLALAV